MNFSKGLMDEATQYLAKKTGEEPDKGLVEEFLRTIAKLGKLFAKNAKRILRES